jgi:hypothetical protein
MDTRKHYVCSVALDDHMQYTYTLTGYEDSRKHYVCSVALDDHMQYTYTLTGYEEALCVQCGT